MRNFGRAGEARSRWLCRRPDTALKRLRHSSAETSLLRPVRRLENPGRLHHAGCGPIGARVGPPDPGRAPGVPAADGREPAQFRVPPSWNPGDEVHAGLAGRLGQPLSGGRHPADRDGQRHSVPPVQDTFFYVLAGTYRDDPPTYAFDINDTPTIRPLHEQFSDFVFKQWGTKV